MVVRNAIELSNHLYIVYGAWAGFTTFVALCGVVFALRFVRGDWVRKEH